jgi:hypothetical protein
MVLHRNLFTGFIEAKADSASDLWERYGEFFLEDASLTSLLDAYRSSIRAASDVMRGVGVSKICAVCDTDLGGSCCGDGIENKYDSILLLVNHLLGNTPVLRPTDSRSCRFLGAAGCTLTARAVLCVNYLCDQVKRALGHDNLLLLQEATSRELDLQFKVHEELARRLNLLENRLLPRALDAVREFYDGMKIGVFGNLGNYKSTDLSKFSECLPALVKMGVLDPSRTVFCDLGCADGRVNVLMSYWARKSLGVEIDEELLATHDRLLEELTISMKRKGLPPPPRRIRLLAGDSLADETYRVMKAETGYGFQDVDLFYTHFTLHDVFAEKIAASAKQGAVYVVYGLDRVLPHYPGLRSLTPDRALNEIMGVYRKETL